MNKRDCKDCKHFTKYYGNKNARGERVVSNYWCIEKSGFIKKFPVKCERKEVRQEKEKWN